MKTKRKEKEKKKKKRKEKKRRKKGSACPDSNSGPSAHRAKALPQGHVQQALWKFYY